MVAIKTIIEELETDEIEFIRDNAHEPMTTEGELLIHLKSIVENRSKFVELPCKIGDSAFLIVEEG